MDDLLKLLSKTELFSGLPDEILFREILPHSQLQVISKGQFIIVPQQQVDKLGVVVTGKIHIMHLFPDGNYSLMTALTSADILGADLVCTKTQLSPYHAVAASPVKILYFPICVFSSPGLLTEFYRLNILGNLLAHISNENMKKEYRLAILSQKGLRERIITYLTMQAGRRRKNTFAISFSREELASFLCVNRSALSHELSLMQQEGLISFRKNVFTLHNWETNSGRAFF